jgi:hypothetical protein
MSEQRTGETLKSDKDAAKALLRAFEGRMIQLDAADIAELITAAREEEREACALACEAYRDGDSWKTDELRRETHRLTAKWCAAMCRHPGYRQSGGCSGEARPEAGRDDAADWDPCRWCSAGIETVRHLPGGTCPRTGRTRPGRESPPTVGLHSDIVLMDAYDRGWNASVDAALGVVRAYQDEWWDELARRLKKLGRPSPSSSVAGDDKARTEIGPDGPVLSGGNEPR